MTDQQPDTMTDQDVPTATPRASRVTDEHEIRISRPAGRGPAVVEIDGVDYADVVTSVTVDLDPQNFTRATLDLAVFDYQHAGAARVILAPRVSELLQKFGWFPPRPGARIDHPNTFGAATLDEVAYAWHRAMADSSYGPEMWDRLPPDFRDRLRTAARAALSLAGIRLPDTDTDA